MSATNDDTRLQTDPSIYYCLFTVPPSGPILVFGTSNYAMAGYGIRVWHQPGLHTYAPEAIILSHPAGPLAPESGAQNIRAVGFAHALGYMVAELAGPHVFMVRNLIDRRGNAVILPILADCARAGWDHQFITTAHAWIMSSAWAVNGVQ